MKGRPPEFLERSAYRKRRLRDAVRIMPVVGLFAMLLPLQWGGGSTWRGGVYLFAVWIVLIVISGLLATRLGAESQPQDGSGEDT